jgi:hypothetical protein
MPLNKAWHSTHRMPAKATMDQRIRWHVQHAKNCGCRPIPKSVAAEITRRSVSGIRR